MYQFTPDAIDRRRAHHQAIKQDADDVDRKRIGNLGEIAFEQFCREYLPAEMWEWKNEGAIRRCNPESFAGYDFEVFGHKVDVKTSRDVSAFLPESLVEADAADDIIVMVWHRDNEDSLMLLGWEHVDTLVSKVTSEEAYGGAAPDNLAHLAMQQMNDLQTLGPNTAHLNQTPENPFSPGDRVEKRGVDDPSVGVVVEVLPPETQIEIYGQEFDGEAVRVAFPSALADGAGDWREIESALLASYCDDQDVDLYTYKHENLMFAEPPFVPGDPVIKPAHDDPDTALVVARDAESCSIDVVYASQVADDVDPGELSAYCDNQEISTYTYDVADIENAS